MVNVAAGSYNDFGEFVAGSESVKPVKGTTSPVSSKSASETLQAMPEGYRLSDTRMFFLPADTDLKSMDDVENAMTTGDWIVWPKGGNRYKVMSIERWGDSHMEVLAARISTVET